MIRSVNKLENDVAAVLGMHENVFQRPPNLFLAAYAYFKGDRRRMVSAIAAGTCLVILMTLLTGYLSFSPFHRRWESRLKIDLPSDPLIKPFAKVFSAVVSKEPTSTQRLKFKADTRPHEYQRGNENLGQIIDKVPAIRKPGFVQTAQPSQFKTDGSLNRTTETVPAKSIEDSHLPDTDLGEAESHKQKMPAVNPATSPAQLFIAKSSTANKALSNRRSGLDALRALRHQ